MSKDIKRLRNSSILQNNSKVHSRHKKTRVLFDPNDYQPLRFGLCLNPLSLVLKYVTISTNKACHHRIMLTKYSNSDFDLEKALDYIKSRHREYLQTKLITDRVLIEY